MTREEKSAFWNNSSVEYMQKEYLYAFLRGFRLKSKRMIENIIDRIVDAIIEINYMNGHTDLTREQIEFWMEKKEGKEVPYVVFYLKEGSLMIALEVLCIYANIHASELTRKIQEAWNEKDRIL